MQLCWHASWACRRDRLEDSHQACYGFLLLLVLTPIPPRPVQSRSRSRSRSPRRQRSSPSPRSRRRSPPLPRRRSPPRYAGAEQYFYSGSSGARFYGHDPYPHRRTGGASWQRRSPSPPPPYGGRGGYGHGRGGSEWARGGGPAPWSPRRGGHPEEPPRGWGWGGPPMRLQAPGGGGVFDRMQPPSGQQHWEHDVRFEWEDEEDTRQRQRGPGGLPHGAPVVGGRSIGPEAQAYEAGMGEEHLAQQAQQGAAGQGPGQAALPWERPSYMDLELQRQQQQQGQPAQLEAPTAVVPAATEAGGVAARLGGAAADPALAVFSRAITQAAASLGVEGRRVATVPVPGLASMRGSSGGGSPGGQLTTFQVTITRHGGAAGQQGAGSAPLLSQPDLQQLLRQRLRQMELELVKLRAEQAERALQQARQQRDLTAAAKLE